KDESSLPEPSEQVLIATGQHLRITGLPKELGDTFMRVTLHRPRKDGWSEEPAGTADSSVNPENGMWQNLVFAVVPRKTARESDVLRERLLSEGRYLARLYLDRSGSSEQNRVYHPLPADLYREVEITGEWKPGWREPMIIDLK